MFPAEKLGKPFGTDEFGITHGVEEAVAKELDGIGETFIRHAVECAVGREESISCEQVEMGVKDEVVAKGMHGSDGSDTPIGQVKAGAKCVLESGGRGVEDMGEEVPTLAKNATEDFGYGEDKLAVRNLMADTGGYPCSRCAHAALMTSRAEMACLASEG